MIKKFYIVFMAIALLSSLFMIGCGGNNQQQASKSIRDGAIEMKVYWPEEVMEASRYIPTNANCIKITLQPSAGVPLKYYFDKNGAGTQSYTRNGVPVGTYNVYISAYRNRMDAENSVDESSSGIPLANNINNQTSITITSGQTTNIGNVTLASSVNSIGITGVNGLAPGLSGTYQCTAYYTPPGSSTDYVVLVNNWKINAQSPYLTLTSSDNSNGQYTFTMSESTPNHVSSVSFTIGLNEGSSQTKTFQISVVKSTDWKFAWVIARYAKYNGVTTETPEVEIANIKSMGSEFCKGLYADSKGKINPILDIFVLDKVVSSFSNYGENEKWVSNANAEDYFKGGEVDVSKYDHLTFFVKCTMPASSYFGLGGPYMTGFVGYSLINNNFPWSFTPGNKYREAVVMHEFLHFIENWSSYLGYTHPVLHDAELHGYTNEEEWHAWYRDYINNTVPKPGNPSVYYGINEYVWKNPPLSKRASKMMPMGPTSTVIPVP